MATAKVKLKRRIPLRFPLPSILIFVKQQEAYINAQQQFTYSPLASNKIKELFSTPFPKLYILSGLKQILTKTKTSPLNMKRIDQFASLLPFSQCFPLCTLKCLKAVCVLELTGSKITANSNSCIILTLLAKFVT